MFWCEPSGTLFAVNFGVSSERMRRGGFVSSLLDQMTMAGSNDGANGEDDDFTNRGRGNGSGGMKKRKGGVLVMRSRKKEERRSRKRKRDGLR